jgi:hypothetical protein
MKTTRGSCCHHLETCRCIHCVKWHVPAVATPADGVYAAEIRRVLRDYETGALTDEELAHEVEAAIRDARARRCPSTLGAMRCQLATGHGRYHKHNAAGWEDAR